MRTVVVTGPPRADVRAAEALGAYGVATVHEALGRLGYIWPEYRPAWPGAGTGGTAVTALCWPGDNLMIHVAVEQCRAGDVLVVGTTSPTTDGLFGELFATALVRRGVRGVVLASGVRDVADLREMRFPAWFRAVSAQGSVKATPGAVNVPVVLGGQVVSPGDVVLGDDDGVMVVPRADVPRADGVPGSPGQGGRQPRCLRAGRARAGPVRPASAAARAGHRVRQLRAVRGRAVVSYDESGVCCAVSPRGVCTSCLCAHDGAARRTAAGLHAVVHPGAPAHLHRRTPRGERRDRDAAPRRRGARAHRQLAAGDGAGRRRAPSDDLPLHVVVDSSVTPPRVVRSGVVRTAGKLFDGTTFSCA